MNFINSRKSLFMNPSDEIIGVRKDGCASSLCSLESRFTTDTRDAYFTVFLVSIFWNALPADTSSSASFNTRSVSWTELGMFHEQSHGQTTVRVDNLLSHPWKLEIKTNNSVFVFI